MACLCADDSDCQTCAAPPGGGPFCCYPGDGVCYVPSSGTCMHSPPPPIASSDSGSPPAPEAGATDAASSSDVATDGPVE
jgi:hypothetical protein